MTLVDTLLPRDIAFMARTDVSQLRHLGMGPLNLDTITGHALGILGSRPSVRHQSCVTDEILVFLEDSGLQITEDIRVYRDEKEALHHASTIVHEGFRLFGPYPLSAGYFSPEVQLVSAKLWGYLNSKANLQKLVPSQYLAPRRLWRIGSTPEIPSHGVFLKFSGIEPTGQGYCVRYCPNIESFEQAIAWFRLQGCEEHLVCEDVIETEIVWGVNICVTQTASYFLGAAEQIVDSPGQQTGSIIDHTVVFPPNGVELVRQIGEMARALGFIGIAGFDIGYDKKGRLFVFDANFRITASTSQVILHQSSPIFSEQPVSHSFHVSSSQAAEELISRLRAPIMDGWLMPTRLIDGRWLGPDAPASACTGFVLGRSRQEAEARVQTLSTLVS